MACTRRRQWSLEPRVGLFVVQHSSERAQEGATDMAAFILRRTIRQRSIPSLVRPNLLARSKLRPKKARVDKDTRRSRLAFGTPGRPRNIVHRRRLAIFRPRRPGVAMSEGPAGRRLRSWKPQDSAFLFMRAAVQAPDRASARMPAPHPLPPPRPGAAGPEARCRSPP